MKPTTDDDHSADLEARRVLFFASALGPDAVDADPEENPQGFVLYAALHRLFHGGRAGRAAAQTVITYATSNDDWGRVPARVKRALRQLEEVAHRDVIPHLPEGAEASLARTLRCLRSGSRFTSPYGTPQMRSGAQPPLSPPAHARRFPIVEKALDGV